MKTNKGFYSALNNENRYSLQSFFCIGFYILPETNTKKGPPFVSHWYYKLLWPNANNNDFDWTYHKLVFRLRDCLSSDSRYHALLICYFESRAYFKNV